MYNINIRWDYVTKYNKKRGCDNRFTSSYYQSNRFLNFLKIFSLTLRFGSKLSERWNFSSACFSSFDKVSGICYNHFLEQSCYRVC